MIERRQSYWKESRVQLFGPPCSMCMLSTFSASGFNSVQTATFDKFLQVFIFFRRQYTEPP